jgi:hypothetical protein
VHVRLKYLILHSLIQCIFSFQVFTNFLTVLIGHIHERFPHTKHDRAQRTTLANTTAQNAPKCPPALLDSSGLNKSFNAEGYIDDSSHQSISNAALSSPLLHQTLEENHYHVVSANEDVLKHELNTAVVVDFDYSLVPVNEDIIAGKDTGDTGYTLGNSTSKEQCHECGCHEEESDTVDRGGFIHLTSLINLALVVASLNFLLTLAQYMTLYYWTFSPREIVSIFFFLIIYWLKHIVL